MSIWIIGGGGGEGARHVKILMIYRNGIGPKCAPDVTLLNSADELSFCENFSTRFAFKIELKNQVLNWTPRQSQDHHQKC